jgi:hypothetical protein
MAAKIEQLNSALFAGRISMDEYAKRVEILLAPLGWQEAIRWRNMVYT